MPEYFHFIRLCSSGGGGDGDPGASDDDGIWRAWCRHQNDVIWWKQPCARICDVTTILADAPGKLLLLLL